MYRNVFYLVICILSSNPRFFVNNYPQNPVFFLAHRILTAFYVDLVEVSLLFNFSTIFRVVNNVVRALM